MIINNTNIMPDSSEIIRYDDAGLPLYVRRAELSSYPNMRAAAHWHEDFEFIEVESGEMLYSINGQSVHLGEGDVLFVNSRQLHFGFAKDGQECIFLCVLIHPSLVCRDNPYLWKSMEPMTQDASFPFYIFRAGDRDEARQIQSVYKLKAEHSYAYRFGAIGKLTETAGAVLDVWHSGKDRWIGGESGNPQLDLQRRMVSFIEENYSTDITLDSIAESAAVSRSTCCRLFRRYVRTSPIGFLNSYRLQIACELLRSTDQSVTDIASRCGFNHTSYFSHLFQSSYGCTPREYRSSASENDRKAKIR